MKATATGIVHFGPGAFHRAHQADYIDRLLDDDPRWGIAAVSLRSGGTVEALRRQQGRYTLAVLDETRSYRTLAAHREALDPADAAAVRRRLADPAVRIVTSTVTEKGYCLTGDGTLDFDHPDIVQDLETPDQPRSLTGWLALGLADRRAARLPPFATLCCDNMAGNGRKLAAAARVFAARADPELARWIEGEARFPDTMVDSITPATTDALRREVREATGFDDAIPVAREAFAAWAIEDALPAGGPDLAGAGAILTGDVAAHERAKLRILNGAHSTLAYLGLLRGHATVAEAMADPWLAATVAAMIGEEIAPMLRGRTDIDLDDYAAQTLRRFRNPAIGHQLAQIAWDGSQKLPYRLLDTIAEARAAGRPFARLALAVAGWMRFVERQARRGAKIVDPLGERLAQIAQASDSDAALIEALLGVRQIFPAPLACDTPFRESLRDSLVALQETVHA
ncbi:mannitol dehydrogenase family protein [Sphingosinicella sp.]|uniref:mannitol dehydrogenase family protein n=1 Tax=Sphingosinicella sp. TaxID=1917971 RepID=UPI004037A6AE